MGRKHIPLDQRKVSLTLSVPYPIWVLAKEKGGKVLTDAINLGLWAKKENVNHISLLRLKQGYEDKIVKLQGVIEGK